MRLLLSIFVLAIFTTDSPAQNAFEKGKKYYEMRAVGADSFRADPININKAISEFDTALKNGTNPEMAAAYLLRSYYFKGMFTEQSDDQKKEIFEKGRSLGEKMIKKYPKSVPIKFWYGANLGRWANVYGFVKSATNGIASTLRKVSKDIIKLDPEYQGGGGYRILAQVHYYSPNIPVLLGWPSDDKAMKLVKKALNIAPDYPSNRMLYAELLMEFDRNSEAEKELREILDMEVRPDYKVEDLFVKHRCRMLLQNNF